MARPKFDRHTTGTEVAETFREQIRGRSILLVGPSPNSIGEATALAIARHRPALLILAGRSPTKLDVVAASCRKAAAAGDGGGAENIPSETTKGGDSVGTQVHTVILDLTSLASVRAAATQVANLTDKLDILINNAGISTSIYSLSSDGIESHFATNHVGPFLLTKLVLPLVLRAGRGARIVNVTSSAHVISPVRFTDFNFDNEVDGPKKGTIDVPKSEQPHPKSPAWTVARSADSFPGTVAYGQSKTANILFTVALRRRLADQGIDVLSVHPGEIRTNLMQDLSPEFKEAARKWPAHRWKTFDQGCATTLVAALDPELAGTQHVYLDDCQAGRAARWATDPALAERLWHLSEQLVASAPAPPGSKL